MSAIESAFAEFGENSRIEGVLIQKIVRPKEFKIRVQCPEKTCHSFTGATEYMKFTGNMEVTSFHVRGTLIFKSQKLIVLNHCMILFTFLLSFKKKILLSLVLNLIKKLAMKQPLRRYFTFRQNF